MNRLCMNEITTMHAALEEDFVAYHKAGFTAVEITLWKVHDYLQNHSMNELKQLFQNHGLTPVSACSRNAYYQAFGDTDARQACIDAMKEDFALMQQLGCSVYISGCNAPDQLKESSYDDLADYLVALANTAQPYDVILALEFNYCKPINSIHTVKLILNKTNHPNIKFVFDTCHFHKSPSKLEDLSLLKAEDIALVHVTDLEDVPVEIMTDMNRVIPGNGIVPIGAMIDKLMALGYEGYYSVEIFNEALWNLPVEEVSEQVYQSMLPFMKGNR